MPTWNQFAWSVLFYWAINDQNQGYQDLMGNELLLLNTLRNDPARLSVEQIQEKVSAISSHKLCIIEESDGLWGSSLSV